MANSDMFGSHWLPQAGFTLRPIDNWSLKASVAKGYRNPSFRELYLYPPHNPELDPESMMNYEVTVSHAFSQYLNVDVTGYFAEGSNIIQTVNRKNLNTGSFRNPGYNGGVRAFGRRSFHRFRYGICSLYAGKILQKKRRVLLADRSRRNGAVSGRNRENPAEPYDAGWLVRRRRRKKTVGDGNAADYAGAL